MSAFSSGHKVRCRIETSEDTAEILVTRDQSRVVAKGRGTLLVELSPGLYIVRVRAGLETQEQLVALQLDNDNRLIKFPPIKFSSPVPLRNTARVRKEHIKAAKLESRNVHAQIGSGSWIFIFVRDDSVSGQLPQNPARGLSLRTVSGEKIDLTEHGKCNFNGFPWAACNVQLNPGIYRLALRLPTGEELSQTLVATLGWQTQVFLLLRSYGSGDRYADLQGSGVLLTALRRGEMIPGFHPEDTLLRRIELARLGMLNRSNALTGYIREQLENGNSLHPMIGLYGASMMPRDTKSDLQTFNKLIGDLRQQGLSDHPDVQALEMLGGEVPATRFTLPPMLRRSWDLILQATICSPDLVPTNCMASQMADAVWGEEPWLLWMVAPEGNERENLGRSADTEYALEALLSGMQSADHESLNEEWMQRLVMALRLPRKRIEALMDKRQKKRNMTASGTRAKAPSVGSVTNAKDADSADVHILSSVDIVIITIREDENRAVLERVVPRGFLTGSHRTYSMGIIECDNGSRYTVAIVKTFEQGPVSACNTTRDAIEDLNPHWIVLVGIAGAVPDNEFTLGDVVLASRLHDFTVSAVSDGSLPDFTNQGGPMKTEIRDLLALLPALDPKLVGWNAIDQIGVNRPNVDPSTANLYGSPDWQDRTLSSIKHHFQTPGHRTSPIFTTRAVASSGSLIKSTEIMHKWRTCARDIAAVEMELAGVYDAARRRDKEYPVLAIRGISDIVGFKRSHEWTNYACHTAASFCVSFFAHVPRAVLCRGDART